MNYAPILCGKDSCRYENECVAEQSGFDPDSCVPDPNNPPEPEPLGVTGIPTASPPEVSAFDAPSGSNSLVADIGLLMSVTAIFVRMMM